MLKISIGLNMAAADVLETTIGVILGGTKVMRTPSS